jgi:hypothetical protein
MEKIIQGWIMGFRAGNLSKTVKNISTVSDIVWFQKGITIANEYFTAHGVIKIQLIY